MLDVNFIRNNLDTVKQKLKNKNIDFSTTQFQELDNERRRQINDVESIKFKRNTIAKEIGKLKSQKKDTAELEQESIALSTQLTTKESELAILETNFQQFILTIPNLPDNTVPVGKDSTDNQVVREWGSKPNFSNPPKPHWEIGENLNFLDFQRAAKISGSRFALYFNQLAKLERVLIQFMLDTHADEHGYCEVVPPFLVNDQSLIGTGNLPKFKDDLFKIENYNLYLIPTAEVPLTNIFRDETLLENNLPAKYVAYTPCFRSEAGSHGKDIRGLIRQHQFNKVELLKFTTPDQSWQELESLTQNAERILQKLNLHYRVMALCSGDLSFSSAKTYDIEVWMPARNGYVEISSCSNFLDFQARRARIKYKTNDNKKEFVHTINGSGLAIGRTVAAIMENYQDANGNIHIPDVLTPYFKNKTIL